MIAQQFIEQGRAKGWADSTIKVRAVKAGIEIPRATARELGFRPSQRPTLRAPGDALVAWAEANVNEDGLAVMLSLFTSLRANDVLTLTWENITNGVLTVTPQKTKRQLKMLLSDRLLEYLDRFPAQTGRMFSMSYTTWWRHFKQICKALDLPLDLSPHSLRVTAISQALDQGATIPQVMAMSGHTNMRTVNRYYRPSMAPELAASAKLNY